MRKLPKLRRPALWLWIAGCALLGGCVNIDRHDAFPVAGPALDAASLRASAGPGSEVRPLEVSANNRWLTAYYVRHARARGVLIFFGGSGNEVAATIKVLGPRTARLGLDLVAFSYYQQGEEVPSVAQVRAEAAALYATVKRMDTPATRSVYLVGYSLGGWFALDVAASDDVRGLELFGAEPTPAAVSRMDDAPRANFVPLRTDVDARQLDASHYAAHVRAKTLVVTSRQDEAVPATVGQEVYDLIPSTTPKRLLVLDGTTHGRYFLSDEFWRQFGEFYGFPPAAD